MGATATITFRSRSEAMERTAYLVAAAAPLIATGGPEPPDLVRSTVESKLLPSGYG